MKGLFSILWNLVRFPITPLRSVVLAVVFGLLLYGVLGLVKYVQIQRAMSAHGAFQNPPEAVTVEVVKLERWNREIKAAGSVAPIQGVTLSVESEGRVAQVLFESGAVVKKGDVLIELDTSVERADLAGARAELERSTLALDRTRRLRESNAVSRDELERAESAFRQARAGVDSLEARIARKQVTAPFDGRTGIRLANIGQYLRAGEPAVPLHDLRSLYVNFAVPQRRASAVRAGQQFTITSLGDQEISLQGTVTAVNPQLDEGTRNVMVQGTVSNPEEILRPGMFTDVTLILSEVDEVLSVPTSAVSFAPYGDSIFIVEKMSGPQGEYLGVRNQIVTLGVRRGDRVALATGLRPGEQVVTSGVFKLRNGVPVEIRNEFAPTAVTNPRPENN